MKNAYLVVPDLHYAGTKANRKNYRSEVLSVIGQFLSINEEYLQQGYETYLLFLGDVIDGSILSPKEAMRCVDLFRFVARCFKRVYTVLGNHEQNNTLSNPFWFLVGELEDESLHSIMRSIQPQSVDGCISVPAILVDGEVSFYFNHYGIAPKVPPGGGVHIGLFHQDIGSPSICKLWGEYDDVEKVSYIQQYSFSYFGHMHLASGCYKLNAEGTCFGEWLGTCVGTTITEVEQLDRQGTIPVILVEDGVYKDTVRHTYKRSDPQEVLDYGQIARMRELQEIKKVRDSITPINLEFESLSDRVRLAASTANLEFLFDLMSEPSDIVLCSYKDSLSGVVIGE